LFQTLHAHGQVAIVTNAEDGWVELSAQQWLPNTAKWLKDHRDIPIVSARSWYDDLNLQYQSNPNTYTTTRLGDHQAALELVVQASDAFCKRHILRTESRGIGLSSSSSSPMRGITAQDQVKWKLLTMLFLVHYHVGEHRRFPICVSIGDSPVEREALLSLYRNCTHLLPPVRCIQLASLPSLALAIAQLRRLVTSVPLLLSPPHPLQQPLDVRLSISIP
jgi:hypothetical protein